MRGLLHFVFDALKRSIGTSIATAVLLLMGINVQDIATKALESPPWWLTEWWSPYVFVFIALLCMGLVFYRQAKAGASSGCLSANMPVRELIGYIASDAKVEPRAKAPSWFGGPMMDARNIIREAARDQRVKLWGRKQLGPTADSTLYEEGRMPIPHEFWDKCQLSPVCLVDSNKPHTEPANRNDYEARTMPQYADVYGNREQAKAVWPRKPLWQRAVARLRKVRD